MYWKYDLDEIEKSLKKDIEHYRKAAEAFSAVVIAKKKNGEEFANLTNAIKNARRVNEYGFDQLRICYKSDYTGYRTDTIDLYGYQDELPDDDPRKVAPVVGYVRQHYTLSADEVRAALRVKIEKYNHLADDAEKELSVIRGYLTAFRETVAAAENELRKGCPVPRSARLKLYNWLFWRHAAGSIPAESLPGMPRRIKKLEDRNMFIAIFKDNERNEEKARVYQDWEQDQFIRDSFSPVYDIEILPFIASGKTYSEKKNHVRDLAIEYSNIQYLLGNLTWKEFSDITEWFHKMGERYHLLPEFAENSLC